MESLQKLAGESPQHRFASMVTPANDWLVIERSARCCAAIKVAELNNATLMLWSTMFSL